MHRRLGHGVVPGYASIIIAVLIIGGIQMLSLGIMGEYIGRMHMNVNRKPQYVVRQVIGPAAPRREPELEVSADGRS